MTSICPDFGICGGCTHQDISYEDELSLKEQAAFGLLTEAGVYGFLYLGIAGSPVTVGYKNKMEFAFGDGVKGGPLEVGIRKKGRYYEIVTPINCNIIDEDYKKILLFTLSFFRETGGSFYHKAAKTGTLRHLVVRKGVFTGEIMVNLVTTPSFAADLRAFAGGLAGLELDGGLSSVLHTTNASVADVVKSDMTALLYGRDFIYERLNRLRFKITPFSFFQTNSQAALVLYETALEFLGDITGAKVLDLYCGTGTISLFLSERARLVTGVEIVPEAVAAARENAALNNIENCEFICGDVSDMPTDGADAIILDPPREGLRPKAMAGLIKAAAGTIVYISCNPKTLARDLTELTQAGYVAEKLKLVDMFPRTAHVEAVVLLRRL